MSKLSRDQQILCLKMLAEGSSIRATERTLGVHRDTIMRLGVSFGERCQTFLDRSLRGLKLAHLEIDEQQTQSMLPQRRLTAEQFAALLESQAEDEKRSPTN